LREKEHGHGGTMSAFTFLKQNYADDYWCWPLIDPVFATGMVLTSFVIEGIGLCWVTTCNSPLCRRACTSEIAIITQCSYLSDHGSWTQHMLHAAWLNSLEFWQNAQRQLDTPCHFILFYKSSIDFSNAVWAWLWCITDNSRMFD
jgi:hypothetical protein